jgi:hypothetical protein
MVNGEAEERTGIPSFHIQLAAYCLSYMSHARTPNQYIFTPKMATVMFVEIPQDDDDHVDGAILRL